MPLSRTAPETIKVSQPKAKPCQDCGGTAIIVLEVFDTGYRCASGYDHYASCPTNFCKHGNPQTVYDAPCDECLIESAERLAINGF